MKIGLIHIVGDDSHYELTPKEGVIDRSLNSEGVYNERVFNFQNLKNPRS